MSRENTLASINIFGGLPADAMRRVVGNAKWRECVTGLRIIERGQPGQEVYFIIEGNVRVLNFAASGRVISFASLGPSTYFGELSAIDGQTRSATVVAETKCVLAVLEGEEFRRLVLSFPQISIALLRRLSGIIRQSDERITDLSSLGAAQRVCLELLRMAEPDPVAGRSWVVYPLPTQANIASRIGTTRETVARMISRLSADGIVERKSKSLYIRDRDRLEALTLEVGEGV